jgi:hypothetical protein
MEIKIAKRLPYSVIIRTERYTQFEQEYEI